jgi:hypothetical protein
MKRRAKTLAFRPPVGLRDGTPDEVVVEFRDSLRRGDVLGVAALLDTEARRPAERDVLIDLSAAEGPERAVRKLSRFWRDAQATATCTRIVSEGEAEVYETIEVAKLRSAIHSVTLLRRRDEQWKVVFTVNAPDTRARLELDAIADARLDGSRLLHGYSDRFGRELEIVSWSEDGGTIVHPAHEWTASIKRNPSSVEIAVDAAPDPPGSAQHLVWAARLALVAGSEVGSSLVSVTGAGRTLALDRLEEVFSATEPDVHQLASVWVRLHIEDEHSGRGFAATQGMWHFGLPEIEYVPSDWPDPSIAARMAIGIASALILGRMDPTLGTIVRAAGHRCRVVEARRGVKPTHTYGRFGAVRIRPTLRNPAARSGTQMRIEQ